MLLRVRLLVVTSPWYYWEYYKSWLKVQKPALLIENKVPPDTGAEHAPHLLSNRIAWNGLLRCRTSAEVFLECMTTAPGSIHLSLHGTLDRLGAIGRKLIEQPDCVFTGPYRPEKLSALLSESSFVWAIDFSEGENSKWLLPYRLYSAIAAGLPVIAAEGTATAEVVRRHDIGMILPECTTQQVIQSMRDCDPRTYERWVQNVKQLRDRALRGNEWALVFDDVNRWGSLNLLPANADVDIVLGPSPVRVGVF
jgi:succinoglycan biosynthesis protein ExoL